MKIEVKMLILVTVVVALLFYLHLLRTRSKEPPQFPGALPLIGHLYYLIGTINLWDRLTKIGEKSIKHGHPYTVILGTKKIYVLTDPEDCYLIAQNCTDKASILNEFVKDLLGSGLLCSKHETWHRHRRLMNPMFGHRVIEGFVEILNTNAKRTVAELQTDVGKGLFDPLVYMREATLRNTFASLTGGIEYGDDKRVNKTINALIVLKESVIERFQKIWLFCDTIYSCTQLKRAQDFNANILRNEIIPSFYEKKRMHSESPYSNAYDNEKIKSFLDKFLRLEHVGLLTEKEILDEMITIVLSSYDTTSVLLTYALVCVGTHPHIQDRLYQEIMQNASYDDLNGYFFNKTNLSKMFYLDAFIKETLRSHTVFPLISRHLDKNISIKNYTLYKGNECMLLIDCINQHSVWGKDASEFKPERWLEPETLPKNLNTGFGLGRRNCIGKKYAMVQSKILLAHVLINYKIMGNHKNIEKKYVLVLEPVAGHYISITKRQK